MHRPYTLLLPLALVAAVFLPSSTAYAQQAQPPKPTIVAPPGAVPEPTITDPQAPAPKLPEPTITEVDDLVIPAPPGAKLRFEMDARSEDLLGLVKSFLKGIGEANTANRLKASAALPAAPAPPVNPIEEALENGNLADILKDVNHLHFAVWELPPPPPAPTPNGPAKPKTAAPDAPTLTPALDTSAFYEGAFQSEGAHRILYTDADEYKLVMVGFPDHHGFAFAASDLPASGGGYVAAARADGYPNMEALSAFISQVTSAVMKTGTGKQIMDATLNGGKSTGADDKGTDKK